ncbi:MAG: pyrroline-5-carboxylate reductase [Candidatus Dadabacteria bacterium]|nr:MAG: pyrroline-5-carboxylate reductase [Candidatus Dadabacteria bacterium]
MESRVAVIGGGNMGYALGCSLVHKVLNKPEDLLIVERKGNRAEYILNALKCNVEQKINSRVREFGIIVVAVKPQEAEEALHELKEYIFERHIVISIMAGVPISFISDKLGGHERIVRCMPNLPGQIGVGITVYFGRYGFSAEDYVAVERVLSSMGAVLRVAEEDLIDGATAISGTGPGYMFYIIDSMVSAAVDLGFSYREAESMIAEFIKGSVELWLQSDLKPDTLLKMVASEGGTTEAALVVFNKHHLDEIIRDGIKAAYERAKKLIG